jgi:hypothetical protein
MATLHQAGETVWARSVDSALDAQPPIRNHWPAYQLGSEPSPPEGFDPQGPQVKGPLRDLAGN